MPNLIQPAQKQASALQGVVMRASPVKMTHANGPVSSWNVVEWGHWEMVVLGGTVAQWAKTPYHYSGDNGFDSGQRSSADPFPLSLPLIYHTLALSCPDKT